MKDLIFKINPVFNCLSYDKVSQTCTLGSDDTNNVDIIAEEDIDVRAVEGGDILIEAKDGGDINIDAFAQVAQGTGPTPGGNINLGADKNIDIEADQNVLIDSNAGVVINTEVDIDIAAGNDITLEAGSVTGGNGDVAVKTNGGDFTVDATVVP